MEKTVYRTISAEVEINLGFPDLYDIIEECSNTEKLNLLGKIVNSMTKEDLQSLDDNQAVTVIGYLQRKEKEMREIFFTSEQSE